ncbi:MAG: hypothetical protein WC496_05500 [Phycisphaerae bacterium]|jgi:hypothetical protein
MGKMFSGYQQKVIRDYYSNIDKIALTKLSELVTEIFLAESREKKAKLWQRVEMALKKLKIPQPVIEHILKQKDPQVLAKNINDWMK